MVAVHAGRILPNTHHRLGLSPAAAVADNVQGDTGMIRFDPVVTFALASLKITGELNCKLSRETCNYLQQSALAADPKADSRPGRAGSVRITKKSPTLATAATAGNCPGRAYGVGLAFEILNLLVIFFRDREVRVVVIQARERLLVH